MPAVGYDSMIVLSGLYCKVMVLVKRRADLGYRSVTEFVAESICVKLTASGETKP